MDDLTCEWRVDFNDGYLRDSSAIIMGELYRVTEWLSYAGRVTAQAYWIYDFKSDCWNLLAKCWSFEKEKITWNF